MTSGIGIARIRERSNEKKDKEKERDDKNAQSKGSGKGGGKGKKVHKANKKSLEEAAPLLTKATTIFRWPAAQAIIIAVMPRAFRCSNNDMAC